MSEYKTDIDIAREVSGEHINDIGAKLNIDKEDLFPLGMTKLRFHGMQLMASKVIKMESLFLLLLSLLLQPEKERQQLL